MKLTNKTTDFDIYYTDTDSDSDFDSDSDLFDGFIADIRQQILNPAFGDSDDQSDLAIGGQQLEEKCDKKGGILLILTPIEDSSNQTKEMAAESDIQLKSEHLRDKSGVKKGPPDLMPVPNMDNTGHNRDRFVTTRDLANREFGEWVSNMQRFEEYYKNYYKTAETIQKEWTQTQREGPAGPPDLRPVPNMDNTGQYGDLFVRNRLSPLRAERGRGRGWIQPQREGLQAEHSTQNSLAIVGSELGTDGIGLSTDRLSSRRTERGRGRGRAQLTRMERLRLDRVGGRLPHEDN